MDRESGIQNRTLRAERRVRLLVLAWLVTASAGMIVLTAYGAAPGGAAIAPRVWPAQSRLLRERSLPELVMLVHPLCPCSRASIAELARLMARLQGKIVADVLFLAPSTFDDQWQTSDLRASAAAIPGVRVHDDVDGEEAQLFGGLTSGQVILYDADGRLRFAGGITAARGHEGGNVGADAIIAAVSGGGDAVAASPVFGCSLVGAERHGGGGRAS
jgi:hypothetical protein